MLSQFIQSRGSYPNAALSKQPVQWQLLEVQILSVQFNRAHQCHAAEVSISAEVLSPKKDWVREKEEDATESGWKWVSLQI